MERSNLLCMLFDDKTVAVLKKLLVKKDIFYLRDLSKESGVSLATTYRIVQRLKDLGIVQKKQQDKYSLYELTRSASIFEQVYNLIIGTLPEPSKVFIAKLGAIGKFKFHITKDKTVFVIGDPTKIDILNEASIEVEAETGTKVKYVLLTDIQFKQMQEIGLIKPE